MVRVTIYFCLSFSPFTYIYGRLSLRQFTTGIIMHTSHLRQLLSIITEQIDKVEKLASQSGLAGFPALDDLPSAQTDDFMINSEVVEALYLASSASAQLSATLKPAGMVILDRANAVCRHRHLVSMTYALYSSMYRLPCVLHPRPALRRFCVRQAAKECTSKTLLARLVSSQIFLVCFRNLHLI